LNKFDDQRHPFCHLRFLLVGRIFIDEFVMDAAGMKIGRGNRHDGKIVPHTKAGVVPERRILL